VAKNIAGDVDFGVGVGVVWIKVAFEATSIVVGSKNLLDVAILNYRNGAFGAATGKDDSVGFDIGERREKSVVLRNVVCRRNKSAFLYCILDLRNVRWVSRVKGMSQ
jgi:hypothetical protein